MLNVIIYDHGRKFRVFSVDEKTRERTDVSASYRLGDMRVCDKDGQVLSGFFIGEPVGKVEDVDDKLAAKRLRT